MDAPACRLLFGIFVSCVACTTAADRTLVPDTTSGGRPNEPAANNPADKTAGSTGSPAMSRTPTTQAGAQAQRAQDAAVSGTGAAGDTRPQAGATASAQAGSGGSAQAPDAGAAADAQVAGGSAAMDAEAAPVGATAQDCDFTGLWAAKQLTVSEALGLPQTSNNWFYLEIKQTGDEIVFVRSLDCGIEVAGTATVTLSRMTLEATLTRNSQDGRSATLKKVDGKCVFETQPFWKVRGADEQRYLPNATRDSADSIAKVAMENPLPTAAMPDGAIDTESDGKLGMAFQVSGVISGVRNSVQRDWSRWFTEPGFEIEPSSDWPSELTIRSDFDNEESILDPSTGLLASTAQPARNAKHSFKLRFLGRDTSDPRATAMIKASDLDTCYAIQDAMPAEAL